ncbi:MAG: sulfite exporter TauE/SafE family protein, partial [Actinomycetota bacterium]|nr:sulfite exporter TauE/SafE family protein [Actinomycetota bacterium]
MSSNRVALLAAGVFAGLLSGLLGVGGGIVIVPLLVLLTGHSQHEAHATSLAAILPIAAIGAATFAVAGEVDLRLAGLLGVGAVVGAPLGARVMA